MKNNMGSLILKILIGIGLIILTFQIYSIFVSYNVVDEQIDSTKLFSVKRTALAYLDILRGELKSSGFEEEGTYYFDSSLLRSGGKGFAAGSEGSEYVFNIYQNNSTSIVDGIRKSSSKIEANQQNCKSSHASFVTITSTGGNNYAYAICMKTTDKYDRYVLATETELNNNDNIIYKP